MPRANNIHEHNISAIPYHAPKQRSNHAQSWIHDYVKEVSSEISYFFIIYISYNNHIIFPKGFVIIITSGSFPLH